MYLVPIHMDLSCQAGSVMSGRREDAKKLLGTGLNRLGYSSLSNRTVSELYKILVVASKPESVPIIIQPEPVPSVVNEKGASWLSSSLSR